MDIIKSPARPANNVEEWYDDESIASQFPLKFCGEKARLEENVKS